jgi:hypothetical protein
MLIPDPVHQAIRGCQALGPEGSQVGRHDMAYQRWAMQVPPTPTWDFELTEQSSTTITISLLSYCWVYGGRICRWTRISQLRALRN